MIIFERQSAGTDVFSFLLNKLKILKRLWTTVKNLKNMPLNTTA